MNLMKTLRDINVEGKRVLVRCDFNVPVSESGEILNDFRIQKSLPTIKYLIENKAKIILMSHLGDPAGHEPRFKMDRIQERIEDLVGFKIKKAEDCIGKEVEKQAEELLQGEVLLLENLRFHKEEKQNNRDFAKALSCLGDIYVNDAFSVSHRAHASIVGVPKFLESCAGFLLEQEIKNLDKIIEMPEKPMVAVIGGKKVETKSRFIDKISEKADTVIISGLLKKEIIEKNIQFKNPEKIIGPTGDLGALDINDKSIKMFTEKILQSRTILWNGPFGKSEEKLYEKGTLAIAQAVIKSKAFSVVGGGETIEFIQRQGIIDKFSHASTGGGAMMTYLSGEELPGLEALK